MTSKIPTFDELVPKAAELHSLTWCVRDQRPRPTASLKGSECEACPEFILNKGICDPL